MLSRRSVLWSFATAPLAVVLADPRLARAAAESLQTVTIDTAGGRRVSGALAVPARTPAPAVLLIHEWWGLNDQIKTMAAEFAREGYLALAVDLYDGKVASDPDTARSLTQSVDATAATDALVAWIGWLRTHPQANGKVATCGWCFGGGWSLNASLAAPVDATVVYYGRVNRSAADLAALHGPVLGHFATQDQFINREMVDGFEASMKEAGRAYTNHWYEADHAFANPTGARYDAEDAATSWQRTLEFLKAHLG